jgi:predicted glycosyltransferase
MLPPPTESVLFLTLSEKSLTFTLILLHFKELTLTFFLSSFFYLSISGYGTACAVLTINDGKNAIIVPATNIAAKNIVLYFVVFVELVIM